MSRPNPPCSSAYFSLDILEPRRLLSILTVDVLGGGMYATIGAAVAASSAGDEIVIASGVYNESVIPKSNTTLRARPGTTPIISGAAPLNGTWTEYRPSSVSTGIWYIDMPGIGNNVRVFSAAGGNPSVALTEAQWPNPRSSNDPFPRLARVDSGSTISLVDSELTSDATVSSVDWTGAQIHYLGGVQTAARSTNITSDGGNTLGLSAGVADGTQMGAKAQYRLTRPTTTSVNRATQILSIADMAGEYYLDVTPSTHRLYVNTGSASAPSTSQYFYSEFTSAGLTVPAGKSGVVVKDITFFNAGVVAAGNNSIFDNIKVYYPDNLRLGNTNDAFSTSTDSGGVTFSGSGNVLRNSEVAFANGNGVYLSGVGNSVINSSIHDTDLIMTFAAPIQVRGKDHQILNNTLFNTARDGIYLRPSPGTREIGSTRIAYNEIFNYGITNQDVGGIYGAYLTGNQETTADHNWIHGSRVLRGTTSWQVSFLVLEFIWTRLRHRPRGITFTTTFCGIIRVLEYS